MIRDEQWLLNEKYAGKESAEYEADKKRLAKGEPLGYVIGWQPFLGLKIYLDSKPLIPRPETEWWVEQLTNAISGTPYRATVQAEETFSATLFSYKRSELENKKYSCGAKNDSVPRNRICELRFLDLCAGSGAIGCAALARMPGAQVYFGEIDPAHEATIQKNIRENNLDASRADIRIGDLFEPFSATNFSCPYSNLEKWKYPCGDMQFDIIAANPPYIPIDRELPASVADHEPARALFAGDDGLDVIRRIATALPKHLAENGVAWVECDSSKVEEAQKLFVAQGFSTEIRTDQYGKPRILVVSFSQC